MTRLDREKRAYTFAIAPLALILFACIVGILLRGINPVEYAGLNRYRNSNAELDARPEKGRTVFFGDFIRT